MAEPIPFLGCNKELKPDANNSDYSLPVLTVGKDFVSCWMLTTEEIERIKETGRVWLRVRARTHPFVGITVDEPIYEDE